MSMKQLERRAHRALNWAEQRRKEGDMDGAAFAMGRFRKAVEAISALVMGGCGDLLVV